MLKRKPSANSCKSHNGPIYLDSSHRQANTTKVNKAEKFRLFPVKHNSNERKI